MSNQTADEKCTSAQDQWNTIVKKVSILSKQYFESNQNMQTNIKCSEDLAKLSKLVGDLSEQLDEQVWYCSQSRGKYVFVIYWKHNATTEPIEAWIESKQDDFSGGESDIVCGSVRSLKSLKQDIADDTFRNLHDVGWYRGTEEIFIDGKDLESLDNLKTREIDYSTEIEEYVRKMDNDNIVNE